jgi:hypothetical protein
MHQHQSQELLQLNAWQEIFAEVSINAAQGWEWVIE